MTVQVCRAIEEHKASVESSFEAKAEHVNMGHMCCDPNIFLRFEEEVNLLSKLYDLACDHFEPGTFQKSVPGIKDAIEFIRAESGLARSRRADRNDRSKRHVGKEKSDTKAIIQVAPQLVEEISEAWGLGSPDDAYSTCGSHAGTAVSRRRSKMNHYKMKRPHPSHVHRDVSLSPELLLKASSQAFPTSQLVSTLSCVVTLLAKNDTVPNDLSWECLSGILRARGGNYLSKAMRQFDPTSLPKFKVLAVAPAICSSFAFHKDPVVSGLKRWIRKCLLSKAIYKLWINSSTILIENGFTDLGNHLHTNHLLKSSKPRKLASFSRNRVEWMFFRLEYGPFVLLVKAVEASGKKHGKLKLGIAQIKELLGSVRISHGIVSRKLDAIACRALMPFLSLSRVSPSRENFEIVVVKVSGSDLNLANHQVVTKLCAIKKMMASRLWSISVFQTSKGDYCIRARDSKAVQLPTLVYSVAEATVASALRQRKMQLNAMESNEVAEFIVAQLDIRKTQKQSNPDIVEEMYFKKTKGSASSTSWIGSVPKLTRIDLAFPKGEKAREEHQVSSSFSSSPKTGNQGVGLPSLMQGGNTLRSVAASPSPRKTVSASSDVSSESNYSQFSEDEQTEKHEGDENLSSVESIIAEDTTVVESSRTVLSKTSISGDALEISDSPAKDVEESESNFSESIEEVDWDSL